MKLFQEFEEIKQNILERMGKRRAFIVAIDGTDHSGKSSLSRYLAWQLEMSVIEADLCSKEGVSPIETDPVIFSRLLNARLKIDRPVIVEGITIIESLANISNKPDYLIQMNNTDFEGSRMFQEKIKEYKDKYSSKFTPDFTFNWSAIEASS